jgi:hypothetical protein
MGRDDVRLRGGIFEGAFTSRAFERDEGVQADDPDDSARLWYLFHKKDIRCRRGEAGIVRRLFNVMLALNGALRSSLGVNFGHRFFGQVHESFGGLLRIAISAGSRFR